MLLVILQMKQKEEDRYVKLVNIMLNLWDREYVLNVGA